MSDLRVLWRGLRAAIIFLTRVPVGGFPYARAEWAWASAHFPLVGAGLGSATALLVIALRPVGAFPACLLAFGGALLLTGGFHEDGLADTSDALGGSFDRDKLLLILKDSRVGTYGASALVISIVGRASLVSTFAMRPWLEVLMALSLVSCAARVGPVWQMVVLPYVTEQGAKSRDVTRAGLAQAVVASAWGLTWSVLSVCLGGLSVARIGAVWATMVAVTLVSGYRFVVRLGGLAGDFLGATEQLCELGGLVALGYGAA